MGFEVQLATFGISTETFRVQNFKQNGESICHLNNCCNTSMSLFKCP